LLQKKRKKNGGPRRGSNGGTFLSKDSVLLIFLSNSSSIVTQSKFPLQKLGSSSDTSEEETRLLEVPNRITLLFRLKSTTAMIFTKLNVLNLVETNIQELHIQLNIKIGFLA